MKDIAREFPNITNALNAISANSIVVLLQQKKDKSKQKDKPIPTTSPYLGRRKRRLTIVNKR